MRYYDTFDSPWGGMLIAASNQGISGIYFSRQKYHPKRGKEWQHAPGNAHLKRAKKQLGEYFAGKRKSFDLELDPAGSPFQKRVWKAIAGVPYGETISYGELAQRAGFPEGARAAGAATGRNPISIVVPCHRIVGSSGKLTGYAGGLDKKRALLALESGERELF
ncbi:MAG TPA: methylated-DNA--[protein]-cysteine S-methyltransferase [Burkholderiales bacterium]|nr:methylated-DNA--[protein]-cysteine S-methyltransferase [Burkholderiales bacterium]